MPDFNNEDNKLGKIDEINRRLYDRQNPPDEFRRSRLFPPNPRSVSGPIKSPETKSEHKSFFVSDKFLMWFLAGSVIAFVLAMVFAFWVISRGGVNLVAENKLDLEVIGPIAIKAGDEVALKVKITNKNKSKIESAEAIIDYPEGTKDPIEPAKDFPRDRLFFGTIDSGDESEIEAKALVFGSEGSEQEIQISLQYRLAGSNALFEKKETYMLGINSSPLVLSATVPAEVNTGQPTSIRLRVGSNTERDLKNVLLVADFPPGWSLSKASIRPNIDDNIWYLGDFSKGDEREILLEGVFNGQDGENKTARFRAGLLKENESDSFSVVYADMYKTVSLNSPFISSALTFNRNSDEDFVAEPGESIVGTIDWTNSLPVAVNNVEFSVLLDGEIIDERTFEASKGFYQSTSNTVTWNSNTDPALSSVSPRARGSYNFAFKILPESSLPKDATRRSVDVIFRVKGIRSDSPSTGPIEIVFDRTITVPATISFSGVGLYNSGPFANSGPIPPQTELETTYGVVWRLDSQPAELRGVTVRGTLPPYVRWTNNISPAGSAVVYNSQTREVIWQVGDATSGSGPKEVAFQVALMPSANQVGTEPILVSKQTVAGQNIVIGQAFSVDFGNITTNISADSGFVKGSGVVSE